MTGETSVISTDLCQALLTEAFPFHLIVSESGCVVGLGDSLRRILSLEPADSVQFSDHFHIQHPADLSDIDAIVAASRGFFLVQSLSNPDLLLRGQLVVSESTTARFLVFLVSPWVTELELLTKLGLNLQDFPQHNPLSDFLMLIQVQRASLSDSQRLSNELSKLNKELEDRVAARTEDLLLKTRELEKSRRELEHEMQERSRMELELRHAQKLEAVGQLAAGVAHEINTPMQYIGNSLQFLRSAFNELNDLGLLLEDYLDSDQESSDKSRVALEKMRVDGDLEYIRGRVPKALDRALDGIGRVTKIVRAMNEFTHPDSAEKSPADLVRALDATITIASNEYKYHARIVKEYQEIPYVDCYLGDLNQVFLNLIVNAAHAIAAASINDGTITVKTWMEGATVYISIGDNGTGIPQDIQHRVFDPFFTTKEVGRGTGQGLSISHKIVVEKHGGKLAFETKQGCGTTFVIALPVSEINPIVMHRGSDVNQELAA